MKLVCSWCKTQIGDDGRKDGMVSHGICKICEAIEHKKIDNLEAKQRAKGLLMDTFMAIRPAQIKENE